MKEDVEGKPYLIRELVYVSVFWDEVAREYGTKVYSKEKDAMWDRGYMDHCGIGAVVCVRPKLDDE